METMAMAAAAFRNMGLRKSFNAFYAYLVAQEEMCAHGVIELRLIVPWDGSSRLLDSPPLFPFPCRYALLQRGARGMTAGPLRKAWNAWVERAGRGDPRERPAPGRRRALLTGTAAARQQHIRRSCRR